MLSYGCWTFPSFCVKCYENDTLTPSHQAVPHAKGGSIREGNSEEVTHDLGFEEWGEGICQADREGVFPTEGTEYAKRVCFPCGWKLEDQAERGSSGLGHKGLQYQDSKLGLYPVGRGATGVLDKERLKQSCLLEVALVTRGERMREGGWKWGCQ